MHGDIQESREHKEYIVGNYSFITFPHTFSRDSLDPITGQVE